MWDEKSFKIIPAILFLFCVLEIFELVLIINDMNKTEKLENDFKNDLQFMKIAIETFDKHLEGMVELEKLKIKHHKPPHKP